MPSAFRSIVPAVCLLVAAGGAVQAQATAYAVSVNAQGMQQLVRFSPFTPGGVTTVGPTGVTLTGIDFRPATNVLYGYDGNQLYTVSLATGLATLAFDVSDVPGNVGFDFNPTVDRIRLVGSGGSNVRLNPGTGAATVDSPYAFAPGDMNSGTPTFTAVAYTNSDTDPLTGTALYGIDVILGQLIAITNPNGGTVNTVGSLGLGTLSAITGFDILTQGVSNSAFLAATSVGAATSRLYSVNLGTGAATLIGDIGAASAVGGLALTSVPEPGTWAMSALGLTIVGVMARRRTSNDGRTK